MKLSGRKSTTPGRKQIFRVAADGVPVQDVVARRDERQEGTPLLEPVMLVGERVKERVNLAVLRDGAARMIASLPPALRALDKAGKAYPVVASDWLRADAAALCARLTRADGDHNLKLGGSPAEGRVASELRERNSRVVSP